MKSHIEHEIKLSVNKEKFICDAVEQGCTVKKLIDNKYEFIFHMNPMSWNTPRTQTNVKKSLSLPITKNEIVSKLFHKN